MMRKWLENVACACLLTAVTSVTPAGIGAQEAETQRVELQDVQITLQFDAAALLGEAVVQGAEAASEFWIGVSLEPFLNEVVKAQLNVDHGLSVSTVFPDSPAQKAGVKTYDIVVRAGDAVVKEPADLVKAVSAAKDQELAVVVIRNGKEMTIKVVPAKRAHVEARHFDVQRFGGGGALAGDPKAIEVYRQHIEKAMEALKGVQNPQQPLNMFIMRPGVVADGKQTITAKVVTALPKNVSIQINKEGDQPAKITVKRDGQSWEVTESNLDGLPDDLKLHIQQMLQHHHGAQIHTFTQKVPAIPGYHVVPAVPAVPHVPAVPGLPLRVRALDSPATTEKREVRVLHAESDANQKIEALIEEIRQLRKEVHEIRGSKSDK